MTGSCGGHEREIPHQALPVRGCCRAAVLPLLRGHQRSRWHRWHQALPVRSAPLVARTQKAIPRSRTRFGKRRINLSRATRSDCGGNAMAQALPGQHVRLSPERLNACAPWSPENWQSPSSSSNACQPNHRNCTPRLCQVIIYAQALPGHMYACQPNHRNHHRHCHCCSQHGHESDDAVDKNNENGGRSINGKWQKN